MIELPSDSLKIKYYTGEAHVDFDKPLSKVTCLKTGKTFTSLDAMEKHFGKTKNLKRYCNNLLQIFKF